MYKRQLFEMIVDDGEIIDGAPVFFNEGGDRLLHLSHIVQFTDAHIIRRIFFGKLQLGAFITDKGQKLGIAVVADVEVRDRKSTRLNSSHEFVSRMPSSA